MFDCVSNVVDDDDDDDVNTISWTTVNRPSCCSCRLDIRSMRSFSKSSFLYLY